MRDREHSTKSLSHWWILGAGLLLAIGLWTIWLFGGMDLARRAIGERATGQAVAVVAPVASSPRVAEPELPQEGWRSASDRERAFTELGQAGDSFGGLNALLTAIAGGLVAWAGFMQHQTLKRAREEAVAERESRKVQHFESLFFQLLQLSAAVTARIEGPPRFGKGQITYPGKGTMRERLPGHKGFRALDALAQRVFTNGHVPLGSESNDQNTLDALIRYFLEEVYDRRPSAFGPYFRLLFQTFKHIHESPLNQDDQVRYANIARGQISEGAVLLLAINGLTYDGFKFVPLIEKFGLLEHLHRGYRNRVLPALLLGYRPRAFMGSDDRNRPGNEWVGTPILPQEYFQRYEHARWNAQQESDDESEAESAPTET